MRYSVSADCEFISLSGLFTYSNKSYSRGPNDGGCYDRHAMCPIVSAQGWLLHPCNQRRCELTEQLSTVVDYYSLIPTAVRKCKLGYTSIAQ